jgi:hypothetical protein
MSLSGAIRRSVICGLVAAAGLLTLAGSAAAVPLVTMMTGGLSHGNSTFASEPKEFILDSADGGEFRIHWTQWGASGAIGHGTSQPDHGTYQVNVKLTMSATALSRTSRSPSTRTANRPSTPYISRS